MLKPGLQSRLIVISSVSGGGKTSLIRLLQRNHPELQVAITATSRTPRPEEVDGVHYYFYSPDEFKERLQRNEFLEHALVHGHYYGIPEGPVLEKLDAGFSVILNIDIQGRRTVKEKFADRMISIFLLPPDREIWEDRLRTRGTESEASIQVRLQQGLEEMQCAPEYDYRVTNDILERAAGEISFILEKEKIIASG